MKASNFFPTTKMFDSIELVHVHDYGIECFVCAKKTACRICYDCKTCGKPESSIEIQRDMDEADRQRRIRRVR